MRRSGAPVVVGVALVVAGALPIFLTASLASEMRQDFAFTTSALGLAIATHYVASAVSSAAAGPVMQRAGPTGAMRLSGAAAAIACLLMATVGRSAAAVTAILILAAPEFRSS